MKFEVMTPYNWILRSKVNDERVKGGGGEEEQRL